MQNTDIRLDKIEDNIYILHDKIEELVHTVNIQKNLIMDLFTKIDNTERQNR